MDTKMLFSFIDEIRENQSSFVERRINIDPLSREQFKSLVRENNIDVNLNYSFTVLRLHSMNCGKILDKRLALSLLGRENIRAIIKNKKFLLDSGAADEVEKRERLQRLINLNVSQINDLVAALKKAPKSEPKLGNTVKDLQFRILDVLRENQGRTFSRRDLALKLKYNGDLARLTNALSTLANANKIGTYGEKSLRVYYMPKIN